MAALTFGNVHGVYKPGNVKLRPEILRDCQDAIAEKIGGAKGDKPALLVFHGGSGSTAQEISDAVDYGVVKMNIDTDTQYAFTRPVVEHMFKNYDGVLKIDGEVGNKKMYDPRAWGKAAEAGLAARVVEACQSLRSAGHSCAEPPVPARGRGPWGAPARSGGSAPGRPVLLARSGLGLDRLALHDVQQGRDPRRLDEEPHDVRRVQEHAPAAGRGRPAGPGTPPRWSP